MLARTLRLILLPCFLLAACGGASDPPAVPSGSSEPRAVAAADTAAVPTDEETRRTFDGLMAYADREGLADRPMGEIVQAVAEQLLGKPYVEHMLNRGPEEPLVVSLAGFDCVLYNENVLALARTIQSGSRDYATYAQNVEALRYRDGERDGYCSRLHYFSDWLRDNDRRGHVEIITAGLPSARPFERRINFMSNHREAYPMLADDDDALACIAGVERDLNTERFHYVPQERIADTYRQLQAGDVIAITSSVGGLDIAHTGFVYKWPDGRTGFIHASTVGEVVRMDDLARYVQGIRSQTGIMVARPLPITAAD
jgi:hypothetical protein